MKAIYSIICIFSLLLSISSCHRGRSETTHLGNLSTLQSKPFAEINQMISEGRAKIKDGDLIERTDDDFVSETLRAMSTHDKTYSHCGFAFNEDGQIWIYNNMAGAENVKEQMMRVAYDSFVSPHEKAGFGIFRYDLSPDEVSRLHQVTKENFAKGLKFDKTFDLKTDDKMYCAEMIYKFVKTATNNRIHFSTTKKENFRPQDPRYRSILIKEFEYVALDDLYYQNPFCTEISRYSYRQ